MKNQRLLAVVLGVYLGSVSFGQDSDSSPGQKPAEGDVVRITTNLVQVDAVITDKSGKPITDLKPEELQLLEDSRLRKITHFSYINADTPPTKPVARDNRMPGVPPDRLRPEDVRRTIALIVDGGRIEVGAFAPIGPPTPSKLGTVSRWVDFKIVH